MNKYLAILGARAIPAAHYYGEFVDVWSCNGLHTKLPEDVVPSAWFQMHPMDEIMSLESPEHIEWLQQEHPFPIYMQKKWQTFPSAEELPLDELDSLWLFNTHGSYSCTFSYMLAMAIRKGYAMIDLQGIDLLTPREAYLEVPNFLLWVGMAMAKGIVVRLGGRLAEELHYGYSPRFIPPWAPEAVVTDVIIDNQSVTRKWLKFHAQQAAIGEGSTIHDFE